MLWGIFSMISIRFLAAVLIAFMSACAVTPERAASLSNDELCDMFYSPFSSETTRQSLNQEGNRRKLDCSLLEAQMRQRWGAVSDTINRQPHVQQTVAQPPRTYQTECVPTIYGTSCTTR